jgi:hypothetical protein
MRKNPPGGRKLLRTKLVGNRDHSDFFNGFRAVADPKGSSAETEYLEAKSGWSRKNGVLRALEVQQIGQVGRKFGLMSQLVRLSRTGAERTPGSPPPLAA